MGCSGVDDQRVLSGIVHVLQGGRGAGGPRKSIVDEYSRSRSLLVRLAHRGNAPVVADLVTGLTPARCLADAAYDSDALRARGYQSVIPNNSTRKREHPLDPTA